MMCDLCAGTNTSAGGPVATVRWGDAAGATVYGMVT